MLFVAQSATSGRSCGTFLSSRRSFGTDKQDSNSTVAFLARSWQVIRLEVKMKKITIGGRNVNLCHPC